MTYPEPERTPPASFPPPSSPPPPPGSPGPPPSPPGSYPPPGGPGPGVGWQPPAMGPPPNAYPPLPPEPRRRRRWPWIVLGIVVALLLAVGGCSYVLFRAAQPSIDGANRWLALLDEGRYGEAYDALCAPMRQATSRQAGTAELEDDFGAGIDGYRINNYSNFNGRVTVGGVVTIGGVEGGIQLAMDDDDGDWRVCGYQLIGVDGFDAIGRSPSGDG